MGLLGLIVAGCGGQIVDFRLSELMENQTIIVSLNDGEQVEGTLVKAESDALVIRDNTGQAWKAPTAAIVSIRGPEAVLDGSGEAISESEIASVQQSTNTKLFAISGAAISGLTSFFAASMASRPLEEDSRDPVVYGGTAVGTLLGTYWFYQRGQDKDRDAAIETMREERRQQYEEEIFQEEKRKNQIESEIKRLRQQIKESEEESKEQD
jgi:hypothetical protein